MRDFPQSTARLEQEIRFLARKKHGQEACGVIMMRPGGLQAIEIPNIARDPVHQFELDHGLYLYHERMGTLWGVWHSHPRGEKGFSEADIAIGDAVNKFQILHEIEPNKFTYRRPPLLKSPPLLGRIFCLGLYDCYSFAADFLLQAYGLETEDIDRSALSKNGSVIDPDAYWNRMGFWRVYQPRTGRLVMLSVRSNGLVNHLGVMCRDDLMGHHLLNQLSAIELYLTDFWRICTFGFLTHEKIETDKRTELEL